MSDETDNVIAFPSARTWCQQAGGKHRWLPAWCEGAPNERTERWLDRVEHGAQFWRCEICRVVGVTSTAPRAEHGPFWAAWTRARWRVYALADGVVHLVLRAGAEGYEDGDGALVVLHEKAAEVLSRCLGSANRRGREAALALSGQDQWDAQEEDELVLVTRGTIHGREGLYLRSSVVFPNRSGHAPARRCGRCACKLPPESATTEPTRVWRGTDRQPGPGVRWCVYSASAAGDVLFCVACVDAMLATARELQRLVGDERPGLKPVS
jgi:hypothetical protein